VPALVISPYARHGYIDHQTLSSDAYLKFIEDDFLNGARLNPATDGRPDRRPDVREDEPILGNLYDDFDFAQAPRKPVLLPTNPPTDSPTIPAYFEGRRRCVGCTTLPPAP
jgi:phospholipase C